MSTDFCTNHKTDYKTPSPLLEAFGKYYRGENKNDVNVLNTIFNDAGKKINERKSAQVSLFNTDDITSGKSQQISFIKKDGIRTKLIKRLEKPKNVNIAKTTFKLGKLGGYAAIGFGAAVGLYLLFNDYNKID